MLHGFNADTRLTEFMALTEKMLRPPNLLSGKYITENLMFDLNGITWWKIHPSNQKVKATILGHVLTLTEAYYIDNQAVRKFRKKSRPKMNSS